jgi:hypothetical protein
MTDIAVAAYWPFFMGAEKRKFYYTTEDNSIPPISSVFQYDPNTGSMLYLDYDAAGTWKDTWYYYYDPGFGVAEWRDDYPQTNKWLKCIFGPTKKLVFSEPIGWGNMVELGSGYANKPKVDPLKSRPPEIGGCYQSVLFEQLLDTYTTRHGDTYKDVLVFNYLQDWTKSCTGARYWMAKGVGPVSVQWLGVLPDQIKYLYTDHSKVNLIETARMDAIVTYENQLIS